MTLDVRDIQGDQSAGLRLHFVDWFGCSDFCLGELAQHLVRTAGFLKYDAVADLMGHTVLPF